MLTSYLWRQAYDSNNRKSDLENTPIAQENVCVCGGTPKGCAHLSQGSVAALSVTIMKWKQGMQEAF